MSDETLTLKHAIERYTNAVFENGQSEQMRLNALARCSKTEAALSAAAKDLSDLVLRDGHGPTTRYIRHGDRVIVVSTRGVEIAPLSSD